MVNCANFQISPVTLSFQKGILAGFKVLPHDLHLYRRTYPFEVGYVPQVFTCSFVVPQCGQDNGIVKSNLADSWLDS